MNNYLICEKKTWVSCFKPSKLQHIKTQRRLTGFSLKHLSCLLSLCAWGWVFSLFFLFFIFFTCLLTRFFHSEEACVLSWAHSLFFSPHIFLVKFNSIKSTLTHTHTCTYKMSREWEEGLEHWESRSPAPAKPADGTSVNGFSLSPLGFVPEETEGER